MKIAICHPGTPDLIRGIRDHMKTIVILAVVFFAGCAESDPGTQRKEYFVQNVIDGDTIELVGGKKVRYIGIDTPETMRRAGGGWVLDPEDYGMSAKEYNRALVGGKKVKLEFDIEKNDKYGRLLAYVYTDDGTMVNEEMLKEGYATVYTFPPNIKHMGKLLDAQKEARLRKTGLWGTLETISPALAFENIGRYRVVKGKVTGIRVFRTDIALEFNGSMSAVIYRKNLVFFEEAAIDPMGLQGKSVEVIGKIEDRGGPQIVIDNPSQIRVM